MTASMEAAKKAAEDAAKVSQQEIEKLKQEAAEAKKAAVEAEAKAKEAPKPDEPKPETDAPAADNGETPAEDAPNNLSFIISLKTIRAPQDQRSCGAFFSLVRVRCSSFEYSGKSHFRLSNRR